ncbi:PRD domain-containing protein [Peptostreptococcaceae bacterium AGR-M142]
MKNNFRILKVLNNNIVLAYDLENKYETILIGKGIGFSKKENKKTYIPLNKIQKSFVAEDEKTKKEYFNIAKNIDERIIEITENIIMEAEKKLGKLNSHIHIILTDHIAFAIERVKMGLNINNPFINEIEILYKDEFLIAKDGVQMIKSELDIDLGFGEIGFIAMHLHSSRNNVNVKETMKNTRILNEIIEIIEINLNIKFNKSEYTYKRLVNHIQGALERIRLGKNVNNPILNSIKEDFRESFKIIRKIQKKIEEEYELEVSEQELGYMAIHVERLKINN